jgi:hypothetical protein
MEHGLFSLSAWRRPQSFYFIQRKGFLDGDRDYLRNRLIRMREEHGRDKFYSFYRYFLLRLFHEGLGRQERTDELESLLGRIPYLNGGLFDIHELEQPDRYGQSIEIPDIAFEQVFNYFDRYHWHLDERPLRADNEINPDVLGYIFEKYVNQKQMGAYYTKEDITEYISKNTVIPFLFDAARTKCKIAFENPNGSTIWDLLRSDPDRFIYPAVRHGVTWHYDAAHPQRGEPLAKPFELPSEIAVGLNPPTLHRPVSEGPVQTLELRKGWNRPASQDFALPTETWREVIARRKRYEEVRSKLAAGEERNINDLITLNLDIRQFAQDVIENCEGPELVRAFWHAIEHITVLDPACGSGAFLFAALNILEPLYEACLDRMESFVEDLERSGTTHRQEKYADFRKVQENVAARPNRRYFILKSIILNNLFGVDIMVEAVEICKLRLFLKLAAQVEPDKVARNLGIEPLPNIDFNIRAGNTLIGYANFDEVKKALASKLDFDNAAEAIANKAADAQLSFDRFRQRQIEGDDSVPAEHKQQLCRRLQDLEAELNHHLAAEYGVKAGNKAAYARWLKSHEPFHWFIEFYRIMDSSGFDVIIGNPPYLEYSNVQNYQIRQYATERCANLYAFTVERSLALCGRHGRLSMIIPISVACSDAMAPLRESFVQSTRSVWLSHFSNRPGQLFTGAQNRLTVFVTSSKQAASKELCTRYHRWDGRNGERDNLFALLRCHELSKDASIFHGLPPKVGCPEAANVMTKLRSNKSLRFFTSRGARQKVHWVRVPGYFCQFLIRPPMARPEHGGPARVRGEVNEISFDDKSTRDVVHSILNSSTYYQFFCVYTDTRHINPSDVAEFPLNLESFGDQTRTSLSELSEALTRCFTANTTQWRKSRLLIDSIDSRPCKSVLDEIDCVLAGHYGSHKRSSISSSTTRLSIALEPTPSPKTNECGDAHRRQRALSRAIAGQIAGDRVAIDRTWQSELAGSAQNSFLLLHPLSGPCHPRRP